MKSTSPTETERNKQRVREIIEKIVNGGDLALCRDYYREDYIQHNPMVEPGRAGLVKLLEALHAAPHPMRAEIEMMNAEDDRVWVLLRWSGGDPSPGATRLRRAVEIFRVEDGLMAEHWDLLEFGTG